MSRIYFDTFENSYTFEKDSFAPPERYFEVIPLLEDYMYTEIWTVDSEEEDFAPRISISYAKMDIENDIVSYLRKAIANEYSIKLLYMTRWAIPKEEYDKILKEINECKYITIKENNINKLDEFLSIEENWDGEGAWKFNKKYINHVKELINSLDEELQPEIFPLQDGLVVFEWGSVSFDYYCEMTPLKEDDEFSIYTLYNDKENSERVSSIISVKKEHFNDFIKCYIRKDKQYDAYKENVYKK